MENQNSINEVRALVEKLQGDAPSEDLSLKELELLATNLILEQELPRFENALKRLGE